MRPFAPLLLVLGLAGGVSLAACAEEDLLPRRPRNTNDPAATDPNSGGATAPGGQLRRLTSREWINTTTDLFPGIDITFDGLIEDGRERDRFDNDIAGLGANDTLVASQHVTAERVAKKVVSSDPTIVACGKSDVGQDTCVKGYLEHLVPRVYRRPPTADELARVTALYTTVRQAEDFPTAMQSVLTGLLMTPQFLFRLEPVQAGEDPAKLVRLQPYEIASRLSYFLWSSMPDDALFAAVEQNALATPEGIEAQVRRMLGTPRAHAAMKDFYTQWLDLDRTAEIVKDAQEFPELDDQLRASIREESERFVDWVTFDGPGTLDALLTSSSTWVDPRLAVLYGAKAPPGNGWGLVQLDPKQRAGILTQANVQAVHGHDQIGSPILRGMFVLERFMCQKLAPPADLPPIPKPADGTNGTTAQTERQMFEQLTSAPACTGCHGQINPLGFAFGHYDALGRWRDTDRGLAIDATGAFAGLPSYDGGVDLATKLASSDAVRACVSRRAFRWAFGRDDGADDATSLKDTQGRFQQSGWKLQELLVAIARSPAFAMRRGAVQ